MSTTEQTVLANRATFIQYHKFINCAEDNEKIFFMKIFTYS